MPLDHPERGVFDIRAIAHALSHINRFTGHTIAPYSVAQHSVLVSRACPPELAFAGLMHDAHEAFVGDVASPIKWELGRAWRELEERVERATLAAFGLPWPHLPGVKHADLVLLATEKRDLLIWDDPEPWPCLDGIEPLPQTITPWSPRLAEATFLRDFNLLNGGKLPWPLPMSFL